MSNYCKILDTCEDFNETDSSALSVLRALNDLQIEQWLK